ncbi:MAG: thioredoxin domain-containing protein, partial [Gammaproteobacteria bacterium]|nr:thioredoxin domain-containing protein [Gammaproteobacteria bacterium]
MHAEPRTAPRNQLAGETSPYLLQHAANPVDWYPWGPAALAKAKELDRPILLSIGYSACHWCHVMAHESFEDQATADVMNRLFVNVKVDREERPDLDKVYQIAHQVLAQRGGGWPLTMFLAPDDLTPYFGGTYFPKQARYGMPAFAELLERVAAFYRDSRDN